MIEEEEKSGNKFESDAIYIRKDYIMKRSYSTYRTANWVFTLPFILLLLYIFL